MSELWNVMSKSGTSGHLNYGNYFTYDIWFIVRYFYVAERTTKSFDSLSFKEKDIECKKKNNYD